MCHDILLDVLKLSLAASSQTVVSKMLFSLNVHFLIAMVINLFDVD